MESVTREFLLRESRVGPRETLILAVSGGVDSVVLAHLLSKWADTLPIRLVIAHAHHGLRPEADGDAEFVGQLAARLRLPYRFGKLLVAAEAQETGESLEMAGRRLRHAFLAEVAHSEAAKTVALAHHSDDQAELVLLRLLRGSGGSGLGGMAPRNRSSADSSITLIRPLLDFKKSELIDYAQQVGLSWREDSSNSDPNFLRNRIRYQLLPFLEREYQPGLRQILGRTASIIGVEADYAERQARRWLKSNSGHRFDRLHVAIQRAVLRQQAWKLGCDLDFSTLERLRHTLKPVTIPGGQLWTRTASGRIKEWHPPGSHGTAEMTMDIGGNSGTGRLGDLRISWTRHSAVTSFDLKNPPPGTTWLDADRVGPVVRVRHWQAGDRFHPLGMPKPGRLQNIFVNQKVPVTARRSLGVAETSGGGIFWVETLPPGEPFKVTRSTRDILEWRWQRLPN